VVEKTTSRDETTDHRLQFVHPDGPQPRDHDQADHDEQPAADDVHGPDVPAHERERVGRPAEAERDDHERDAEADAVREPEQRATAGRRRVGAQREHDREGRTDAGRPSRAERHADQRRAV
jgi:hypothetical protein